MITPVCHTDVRYVGSSYVVRGHSLSCVVWSQPVLKSNFFLCLLLSYNFLLLYLFHIVAESTHENRVPGELTEVAAGKLEDLCCDAVLLHQGLLKQRHQISSSNQ